MYAKIESGPLGEQIRIVLFPQIKATIFPSSSLVPSFCKLTGRNASGKIRFRAPNKNSSHFFFFIFVKCEINNIKLDALLVIGARVS